MIIKEIILCVMSLAIIFSYNTVRSARFPNATAEKFIKNPLVVHRTEFNRYIAIHNETETTLWVQFSLG